ncbi:MAG: aminopeptidase P N-terminal domain-containing protein [Planctomycetes bacterium]|nr:aminopeptidase P N-terminal domain-containing protein [Planctomycetota bacterium]
MRRTAPACLFVLLAAALTAQAAPTPAPAPLPAPPAPLAGEEFRARRAELARRVRALAPEAVVLVRGAGKQADMGPFVQDQDFLYLSGIAEPDLALLLVPGEAGALARDELLVPPFSRFAATWDGNFLAPGEATAQRTGFAAAGNVRGLQGLLDELLAPREGRRPVLFTLTEPAARLGSTPGKAEEAGKAIAGDRFDGRPSREAALVARLRERFPDLEVQSLERVLHPLRPHKSPGEIELLRCSAQIAAEGIAEAMRAARPGRYEYHLAAVARYVFSLRGAGPDAYAAIVGAGPNGCILHYSALSRQLQEDDLIVMDYAPVLHGYASDVTRTFPASGRFTDAQRKLVQDVHEIQQALLADVKPGARLSALGGKCARLLRERGYRSDHGPCHHVGLAVHDPSVDVLEPGMVITVEPGAYLRNQGMGCRIEDTVLVTADGHENLSGHLPSAPDAIEALMRERSVVDVPVGFVR